MLIDDNVSFRLIDCSDGCYIETVANDTRKMLGPMTRERAQQIVGEAMGLVFDRAEHVRPFPNRFFDWFASLFGPRPIARLGKR